MIRGDPRIFLRKVPEDLVLKFFEPLGYKTLLDEMMFTKQSLTDKVKEHLDEYLLILYPYFRKSKRYRLYKTMDNMYYIRILRNLARNCGYVLKSYQSDRLQTVFYRLINPNKYANLMKQESDFPKTTVGPELPEVQILSERNLRVTFD